MTTADGDTAALERMYAGTWGARDAVRDLLDSASTPEELNMLGHVDSVLSYLARKQAAALDSMHAKRQVKEARALDGHRGPVAVDGRGVPRPVRGRGRRGRRGR